MASTRQLSKDDILFVAGETPNVYQHTAGLVILDTSDCPDFNFDYLKDKVIERIQDVPHFRWKLHQVPLGLDMPYWVEDENFSYDNHFRRIAVPSPGDREALAEVVAHLYSKHLDRKRPLWELWLIEGLQDGKYALLQKLHHCMMDGQGASKLGELLCDFEPDAAPRPVDAVIRETRAGAIPDWFRLSTTTALHLARFPGAMSRQVFDIVGPKVLQKAGLGKSRGRRDRPALPVTRFNATIGADRGFVFGSLSLRNIKAVRKAFGVTVNDVLLALAASALRDYLEALEELPALSLQASVPVSLRTEEDDSFSNRVTQVPVSLGTSIEDPVERLRAIHAECEDAKAMAHRGGKGFLELIQTLPPWVVNAMIGATAPQQATQMLGSNLIISNVRGSDQPMYIAGARLDTMYPMSIITSGVGLNFTCVSYTDHVDVGITTEPHLVPEPWQIIEGMQRALRHYLALSRPKQGARRPRRGKTASRRATGGKTPRSRARKTA